MQRVLLPAIQHIALELGDDERQPGNLRREVAQLDAPEVGQWNLAAQMRFTPAAVNFRLDLAHLFVGDNQKVAGAAGRIKHANARHAFAQVQQLDFVIARIIQSGAQVVEKQGIQHLEDVGHAGVVHAQCAALFVVGHGLDHAAEDVRVDLLPVQVACVYQVGARHAGEARHGGRVGEQAAIHIGKAIGPVRQTGLGIVTLGNLDVHGTEDDFHHLMRVGAIALAHLLDGVGEQALAVENVGVFGKETEH